jgi:hypothetical protein
MQLKTNKGTYLKKKHNNNNNNNNNNTRIGLKKEYQYNLKSEFLCQPV